MTASDDWRAQLGGFAEPASLTEYAARYAEHLVLERSPAGVLEVRMHTRGGPALFSLGLKHALARVWREVGADRENEVVVLTGTGDRWIGGVEPDDLTAMNEVRDWPADIAYDHLYRDGVDLLTGLVNDVDVPTIGVLNGPGPRMESALLCDVTICADDVVIRDGNFGLGNAPPGDGMNLVLQHLLGTKRAAYAMLTAQTIAAPDAHRLGLVDEVLPRDQLLPRAREIAEQILRAPRSSRRLAHGIAQRPWRRLLNDEADRGLAQVAFGARLGLGAHD